MHSILRTSARLDLPLAEGRVASRPDEVASFVIDDRAGQATGRVTMHIDVCPLTKTILGFELSSDRRPTSRVGTVAAPGRVRKGRSALRKAGKWSLPGMPRTVVIDSLQFEAPTFRDAVLRLGETGPDPEG